MSSFFHITHKVTKQLQKINGTIKCTILCFNNTVTFSVLESVRIKYPDIIKKSGTAVYPIVERTIKILLTIELTYISPEIIGEATCRYTTRNTPKLLK